MLRGAPGFWVNLLLLLIFLGDVQPGLSAEKVRLRGGIHPGFGRIVFDWSQPVTYQARIDEGHLVIRFERLAQFDAQLAEQELVRFIGPADITSDGDQISFPLRGNYGLKHFQIDKRVVIDLYEEALGTTRVEPTDPVAEIVASNPDTEGSGEIDLQGKAASRKGAPEQDISADQSKPLNEDEREQLSAIRMAPTETTDQDGTGVHVWPDGTRYEGEFKGGLYHGYGKLYLSGGGRYEGEWNEGHRHGQGIEFYKSSGRYEGEWNNGARHGLGTEYYDDGEIEYTGGWRDDKRHGTGLENLNGGQNRESGLIIGEWYGGVFISTQNYEGKFKDGEYHGKGVKYYSNGDLIDGEWRDGKLLGKGRYWDNSNGHWRNCVLIGKRYVCDEHAPTEQASDLDQ